MTGRKEVKSLKTSVNLKTQNGGVACLEEMIFASDLEIPFSKNIPSKEDLEEHGKPIYKNFPIHGKRKTDMVIGIADLYKYKLVFDNHIEGFEGDNDNSYSSGSCKKRQGDCDYD